MVEQGSEFRYGSEFGSGQVITDYVWRLLTSYARNKSPFVARKLAYALAWANGCRQPRKNIEENGAWVNASGDARNNFLFGEIVRLASQKKDKTLFAELISGYEQLPQDQHIEIERVPDYVKVTRAVFGFAQSAPYEVTSMFWKRVDGASRTPNIGTEVFGVLTDRLAYTVEESQNLEGFRGMALILLEHPTVFEEKATDTNSLNRLRRNFGGENPNIWKEILSEGISRAADRK